MTTNKLDDTDRKILSCVVQNPHASLRDIIAYVKGKPSTVHKRVQKLLKHEYLERILRVVDVKRAFGYESRYRIDIHINPRELRRGEVGNQGSVMRLTMEEAKTGLAHAYGVPPKGVEISIPKGSYQDKRLSEDQITTQEKLAEYIMKVGKEFGSDLRVENVTILLGHRADLSATVWVKNTAVLKDFVINGLRGMGGIQATNTALEAWSVQEAGLQKDAGVGGAETKAKATARRVDLGRRQQTPSE